MRYQVHWCRIQQNGETRLEEAERFGADVEQPPELSYEVEHVIGWFWELDGRRQQGFNGPQPISYQEILAWASCAPTLVAVEEVRWIVAMDDAYIDQLAKERRIEEQKKEDQRELEKLRKKASGR